MHGLPNEMLTDQRLRAFAHMHGTQQTKTLQQDTSHERHAVLGSLILDGNGHIVFCSNALAQLVGSNSAELVGGTIKSLLPDMPVSPTTPGYNVAFAAFSCAAGHLHRWTLLRKDGSKLPVEASISSLKTGSQYIFCVGLHCPGEPGVALNEIHAIDSLAPVAASAEKAGRKQGVKPSPMPVLPELPSRNNVARQVRVGINSNFS